MHNFAMESMGHAFSIVGVLGSNFTPFWHPGNLKTESGKWPIFESLDMNIELRADLNERIQYHPGRKVNNEVPMTFGTMFPKEVSYPASFKSLCAGHLTQLREN
jgi:hypothetical protein